MAPGPTPTLTMSAPASMSSRVPSADTTLPATIGTRGRERADRLQRLDHPLLVAVRGVEHEHVDAGLEQLGGAAPDVAVDAHRGRDAQPARARRRAGR